MYQFLDWVAFTMYFGPVNISLKIIAAYVLYKNLWTNEKNQRILLERFLKVKIGKHVI